VKKPNTRGRSIQPTQPELNSAFLYSFMAGSMNKQIQPTKLYHGTTYQNAFEIFRTGLWLVGTAQSAVWMTDNFSTACNYAGTEGAIVVLSIASSVNLMNVCDGVYTYEIPYVRPQNEYYQIQGVTPVGILNYYGNKIA
jgi:hypothetical protein